MPLVRQTQDGVNGNSSIGIPSEYENNSGVAPYVYRVVAGLDEDANGIADQNPGTAFNEIDSIRLSGERIFFHRVFVIPILDSAIDYGALPVATAGPNISAIFLYNLFNAVDPQAALPQDKFPLQANTAFNTFANNNGGAGASVLSVPTYWKAILPSSLNPLDTEVGGIGSATGALVFEFLPAGEYKIICTGFATDADFNGSNVNLIVSHSE